MKNIIKLFVLICLCFSAGSCKESFLDLAPISNSNANNFYQTKADFDLAASAAYADLYTFFAPESGVSYFSEQMSDNATLYNIAGIQADKKAFKDFNVSSTNSQLYIFWQQSYRALFDANIVLSKIDGVPSLDAAYKSQIKAEMQFLRALYYYYMVQLWGDVPYVTTALTADESYAVLRSPKAEILTKIVEDLKSAKSILPLASSIKVAGHASKGAVQALLGKIYLLQGNKIAAGDILKELVADNQYSLLPKYGDLWPFAAKNTKESIFEIQYKGGAATAPISPYYTGYVPFENFSFTLLGIGMNMITDDLYNEFETTDPRRDLSIALGYTNKAGVFVPIKYAIKWVDPTAPIAGGKETSRNNYMVFRYADVLLMLAEATGDATYLNTVRARAGLSAFGSATYPKDKYATLDLAIEHERRVELSIEFHRGFDLRRTGRAVAVLNAKGRTIDANKLLLPIPQTVLTQNPAITQNPGF